MGQRDKALDGSAGTRHGQKWSQARRANELATRPRNVTAVDHQSDSDNARRDAREVPLDLWCRVDRVAIRDEGSGGIPGAPLGGHEGAVPEHRVADRIVALSPGSDDRLGEGRVCAIPIAHRETRDGQLPEREVPPGAGVPLELNRPGRIRERILGALAGHGGPEHRAAGLEGGCAVRRPALERSTLGDVRVAHRASDIARGHLLPGCEHGEPRACPSAAAPKRIAHARIVARRPDQ